MVMLLDTYLPEYHFAEKHSIKVAASNELILNAITDLCPKDISRLFSILFSIRTLPSRMLGKNEFSFLPNLPLLEQMKKIGFRILATSNNEIVFGLIFKNGEIEKELLNGTDTFSNLQGAAMEKIATNFFIEEKESKTIVRTETRIYTSDKKTKRKFALYWSIVHPGSALIRRIWLKAIKKKAESYTTVEIEKLSIG